MGAITKLNSETDLVLKKVYEGIELIGNIWNKVHDTDNANLKEKSEADLEMEIQKLQRHRDQIKTWLQSRDIKDKKALIDARRCIEKELERFKICEKEVKTETFSEEGLEQQPKTDPKEKAKSKTRYWLKNTVSELESQINSFEEEIEQLSVEKGKKRPQRLTHLESSSDRHRSHIMKLELILRLLDNDELSPEEVNDVKDFFDDYVELNQEDFYEFDDVGMLYNALHLDKVWSLEDLITTGPPAPVKAAVASSHQHGDSIQKQVSEKATQEGISEFVGRNPPPKITAVSSAPPSPAGTHATPVSIVASSVHSGPTNNSAKGVLDNSTSSVPLLPTNISAKGVLDNSISSVPSLPMNNAVKGILDNSTSSGPLLSMNNAVKVGLDNSISSVSSLPNAVKEEDNSNIPGRKPSPALPEAGLMNIGRSAANPLSVTIPSTSGSIVSSNGSLRVASLVSSSSIRMMLPQAVKTSEAVRGGNGETGGVTGRMFSGVSGIQWRPGDPSRTQNEGACPVCHNEFACKVDCCWKSIFWEDNPDNKMLFEVLTLQLDRNELGIELNEACLNGASAQEAVGKILQDNLEWVEGNTYSGAQNRDELVGQIHHLLGRVDLGIDGSEFEEDSESDAVEDFEGVGCASPGEAVGGDASPGGSASSSSSSSIEVDFKHNWHRTRNNDIVADAETGMKPKELNHLFRGKEMDDIESVNKTEEVNEKKEVPRGVEAVNRIGEESNQLAEQMTSLEAVLCSGTRIEDGDIVFLTEMLIRQLLKWDIVLAVGESEVHRIRGLIEALNNLKTKNDNSGEPPVASSL